jgi:hypothetical protein
LIVRLLSFIKRPLSASSSLDPLPEPVRHFDCFFTAAEDPADDHIDAVREDPGPFVKGSLDATHLTPMEPDS